MKHYIAYFDYLGFKDFVLNNDREHLKRRIGHLFRDVEDAITEGVHRQTRPGLIVADLSKAKVNCFTISDTVIFWSKDDSPASRDLILSIAYKFNWKNLLFNMPVRGVVCFDELDMIADQLRNADDFIYAPTLLYGKGLINAHVKAESLEWAGCVVDQSVLDIIGAEGRDIHTELGPYAKLYDVPYKEEITRSEFAMNIVSGGPLSDKYFGNTSRQIEATFKNDNKSIDHPAVKRKLKNTIDFLASFR